MRPMCVGQKKKKSRRVSSSCTQHKNVKFCYQKCDVCQSGRRNSQGRAPTTQTTVQQYEKKKCNMVIAIHSGVRWEKNKVPNRNKTNNKKNEIESDVDSIQ